MTSETLGERIAAELNQREKIAKLAVDAHGENWYLGLCYEDGYHVEGLARPDLLVAATAEETAEHIALHDPADAQRRYAVARQVLKRHRPVDPATADPRMDAVVRTFWGPQCSHGRNPGEYQELVLYPCVELRDLAKSLGVGK